MLLRYALVLVALSSCVDRGAGPQGKKIDPSYLREHLLTQAPAGIQHVDVSLGGKVTYLGSRVANVDGTPAPDVIAPGATLRLIHYWQVVQPPGPGWKIFRYARGAAGSADFMNFGPTDMEQGLPTTKWKAGQIIEDTQDVVLRPDWRSAMVTIYVGLVADGGHQLGDRMLTSPATGSNVVDRAIVARTLEVDLSKAPPPAGTVYIPHAAGEIVIDGIASEPGWANGIMSPELVTADGSADPVGKAIARMAWDEQNLYVFVQVTDTDIYSEYKKHDEPLWKQDTVEIFIDADGNRRGYVELQVNPNNTTFDSYFATTRAQPGDETWTSNMQTAVRVRGTADKAGDADQGWDVEIAIPLAAVKGRDDAMNVRLPPQVGDRWKLNVVRVDYRSGGGSPGVASWNRIGYSDFHALDRMLQVVFADATGSIVVKPGENSPGTTQVSAAPLTASGSGSAAPLTGSGAAVPKTGSGSAAPMTGSGSATQKIGSGSAAPANAGSGSAAPKAGSGVGSGTAKPTTGATMRGTTPSPL